MLDKFGKEIGKLGEQFYDSQFAELFKVQPDAVLTGNYFDSF